MTMWKAADGLILISWQRRKIDGWSERTGNAMRAEEGLRIDYIWCSHMVDVAESRVVANGKCYPVMSDHYGVEVFVE